MCVCVLLLSMRSRGASVSHSGVGATGLTRLEIFGAKLHVGEGLAAWHQMAQESIKALRRRYEMICCRRFFATVRELLATKQRVKSFMEQFFVRQQEIEQEKVRQKSTISALKEPHSARKET